MMPSDAYLFNIRTRALTYSRRQQIQQRGGIRSTRVCNRYGNESDSL